MGGNLGALGEIDLLSRYSGPSCKSDVPYLCVAASDGMIHYLGHETDFRGQAMKVSETINVRLPPELYRAVERVEFGDMADDPGCESEGSRR